VSADYLTNPLVFIINAAIGAYIFIMMVRLLLQYVAADFNNPISLFVIRVTKLPLKFLKPVFPTIKNINLSAVFIMVILQMVIGFLILSGQPGIGMFGIFVWSVAELINSLINIFMFSIFLTVILSWISPGTYNPAVSLLYKITEPVMKPFQQFIPPMGGMDLSPMVALLALQVLKMLLIPPLYSLI